MSDDDSETPETTAADRPPRASSEPDAGSGSDAVPGQEADPDPAQASATNRALFRSSGIVAAGTLLSRITGLARTILLAFTIGSAGAANAYNLANTTPNLIYDMLLGGILSATLVPVLVGNRDRGDKEGTDAIVTVATIVLLAITVVGFVLAPVIIHLYATVANGGGKPPDPAEQELAVSLLRLFVPQVLFYGLTTLGTSVLNAQRRFAAAAFAPVVNNVVMFGVLIVANAMIASTTRGNPLSVSDVQDNRELLLVLGLGTTAGIAAMAAVLVPAIWRSHIHLRWRPHWRHRSVVEVARLSGWTLGYVLANQVALFALTAFAWGSSDQAVSVWFYAYTFFQLPYGVFTVSVMTAFTPELASLADRRDTAGFNERFLLGFRLVMIVLLPATALFAVLARPLVSVTLEHGRLGALGADATASTLAALALGIVGFSVYLYVLRGFYALKDTRTPFLINVVENIVTVAIAVPLIRAYGVTGLGLAWSFGYLTSAVIAFVVLHRRIGPYGVDLAVGTTAPLVRMAVAAVAMALVLLVVVRLLPITGTGAILTLTVATLLGGVTYVGLLFVFGVREIREIPRLLTRRA